MPSLDSSSVAESLENRTHRNACPAEFAFLLSCCASGARESKHAELSRLCETPLDWPRVFELGEHHGVLPLVYQVVRETGAHVPPEVLDDLASRYDANVKRSLRFAAELFRILDCLRAAGVAAIPYKGPVLAQAVYGDLALRDFSDLDVLVMREDVPRSRDALRSLGYSPASQISLSHECAYLDAGYEYTFDGPAGRNLLEIQWNIVPHFYAIEFPMRELFARAEPFELAGREVSTLAPEDLLLTLCVHAAKHAWIRLCWLCDIAGATCLPSLDWDVVERRAHDLGIWRIVSLSLALAQRLLAASLPGHVLASFRPDQQVEKLCSNVIERLPAAEEFSAESLEYFRLMLRLRERASDKLRFAARLALTPGAGEWELVRLPAPLFPLYRIVRLLRLAARPFRPVAGNSR